MNNKICLLDTNALSELLKNPKTILSNISDIVSKNTLLGYSAFTLVEIIKNNELYEKYLKLFSKIPSLILDGHEGILEKEVKGYLNKSNKINPIIFLSSGIEDDKLSKEECLRNIIEETEFATNAKIWQKEKVNIINGILSLKKNFPPKVIKYTESEIGEFVEKTVNSQIMMRQNLFYKKNVKNKSGFRYKHFKSVLCTSYVVFYKFYQDDRKPELSDVFDITISSIYPYVDYVFTERNMCEIIRKLKRRHQFLEGLEYYNIKELREGKSTNSKSSKS